MLIGVVLLLLLFLFLLIWFLLRQRPGVTTITPSLGDNEQGAIVKLGVVEPETEEPIAVKTPVETVLQNLVMIFTERYGSYSSESEFANLYDVMELMSASFQEETADFISSASSPSLSERGVGGEGYYGVTTRVLLVKAISIDEEGGTAVLEVSTQQEESRDSPQNSEIKYQTLVLSCVKEGDVWKVASAVWQ